MRKSLLGILFLVLCPLLAAQQGLNNESIIKMVKAGLSDDVIVATINANAGGYDTSPDGLIALKQAGASDKVIAAVVAKGSSAQVPAAAPRIGLRSSDVLLDPGCSPAESRPPLPASAS